MLKREGSEHSIYVNPTTNQEAAVPRHREISMNTVRRICRDHGCVPRRTAMDDAQNGEQALQDALGEVAAEIAAWLSQMGELAETGRTRRETPVQEQHQR